jgi:hypothetical protein
MWLADSSPPTMADVKDNYVVASDREQHPVLMGLVTIKQLPDFKGKFGSFSSEHAALCPCR